MKSVEEKEERRERERERERSNVQSCTNNDGNNVDLVGRRTHPCNIPSSRVSPLCSLLFFLLLSSSLSLSSRNGRWNPMGSIIRRIPSLAGTGCACTWFHDCWPVPGNLPHTWSKLPSSSSFSYYSLFLLYIFLFSIHFYHRERIYEGIFVLRSLSLLLSPEIGFFSLLFLSPDFSPYPIRWYSFFRRS